MTGERQLNPKSLPITLIGFMGCGKSTIGKNLAKILDVDFDDLDQLIEKHQQLKIHEIFEKFGEDRFRNIESDEFRNVFAREKAEIIATGGGIVTNADNRDLLVSKGTCVFLNPPFEAILRRVRENINLRPLAKNSTENEFHDLWKKRLSLYLECASFSVDGVLSIADTADIIARRIINSKC